VSVPFYVPPEQATKEKAEFARKGIARGRPLIVLEYAGGILFVAENPSTHLRKVAELYDRIAFAAVGRFSEFENLRQAGVRLADIRGYAYGREDVSSRSIANAYSQTLGQIFVQEFKPYEVDMELDAALQLAMRVLPQAAPAGETGNSRLEVAVLERDRPRRSFRRLSQEDVASRAGEPAT